MAVQTGSATAGSATARSVTAPPERRRRTWKILWPGAVVGVVSLAAVLRLIHVQTAYQIFIDEVSYTDLSVNVAAGRGVVLNGSPFDLHPPGMFLVFGGLLRLLGAPLSDPVAALSLLRPVEAVIGAVTCGLVVILSSRMVPRAIALAAGLLLALDPFVIRFDSRVMLEAPTMALTVTAMLAVARLLEKITRGEHSKRDVIVAGLAVGCTIVFKETFISITVLPILLVAWLLPRPRRALIGVVGVSAGVYLGYVNALASLGRADHWADQKLSGVRRLLGVQQATGFNKPGSVSFIGRLGSLLSTYGTTYLIIGLATVIAVGTAARYWLTRKARRHEPRAVVALALCWQLGAVGYLAYAVVFGALEEQIFYLALAPSVTVLGLGAAKLRELRLARRPAQATRPLRTVALALAVLFAVVLSVDAHTWWHVHSTRDDAYRQFLAWAPTALSPQDRLAVTDDTAQFITPGVVLGSWATPAEVVRHRANYVLVVQKLVDSGLGLARPSMVSWLEEHGQVVFSTHTPSSGSLRVYRLSTAAGQPGG